jgi:diaminohydroxyphosphoribosylaminopyrimidine deaminase/5-amino-6-(5-phosphoribosylamino)uracil reductase
MHTEENHIKRCFELAKLGAGSVSPNPMVGAVIVHKNRIIGEGYHKKYGQDHAEVMAFKSVKEQDTPLLPDATLYVSLEPCCVYGNTPPCSSLIIEKGIKRVVISALDQSPGVNGQGVKILRDAGVEVTLNVLKEEGAVLAATRNIYVEQKRPYILLKFAQSKDGYFCPKEEKQFWLTNSYSKRLVHKWRGEVDCILVGTKTALIDDPQLTNRLYYGKSPIRLLIDRELKVPATAQIFQGNTPTIVFTNVSPLPSPTQNIEYVSLDFSKNILPDLLTFLHQRKLGILMVEGGIQLLESFISQDLWDEARILTGNTYLKDGRLAPKLPKTPAERFKIDDNDVKVYYNLC